MKLLNAFKILPFCLQPINNIDYGQISFERESEEYLSITAEQPYYDGVIHINETTILDYVKNEQVNYADETGSYIANYYKTRTRIYDEDLDEYVTTNYQYLMVINVSTVLTATARTDYFILEYGTEYGAQFEGTQEIAITNNMNPVNMGTLNGIKDAYEITQKTILTTKTFNESLNQGDYETANIGSPYTLGQSNYATFLFYINMNITRNDSGRENTTCYVKSIYIHNSITSGITINTEVIDIPGIMFNVLTMPLSFISTAFNLTLFPGTPYSVNISALFLTLIGLALLFWLFRKIKR